MAETEELTEQQIIGMFKQMRADQQSILAKISEIEAEINEHKYFFQPFCFYYGNFYRISPLTRIFSLVIGATEKLEPTRKVSCLMKM